jgi:ferrous iron transport protein B
MLASVLIDQGHPFLGGLAESMNLPAWLSGLLIDGMYLTLAWVVSVMLPPMMIFFPLFTLLEDFGYLPRVAYNLDGLFRRSGAHGKQSLSMAMGFGCNAAGVIATRVIDSPRERLIAILTNNFALCNGRWPTQILIGTIFIGALAPAGLASLFAAGSVFAVAALGIVLTMVVSFALSRSLLKGEASVFSLELPPYRPPNVLRTLYVSLIDRTIFVLWRAIVFAVPAGAVIWLICNIDIGNLSIAEWSIHYLDTLAWPLGLTGVILLAYVVAIPANEIVIPTILMLTVMATGMQVDAAAGAGVMFETSDEGVLYALLTAGGWTTLTAICLMLFSLCHNPCSTTLYTIYKETNSLKWTAWAAIIPTALGVVLCALVAVTWRLFT